MRAITVKWQGSTRDVLVDDDVYEWAKDHTWTRFSGEYVARRSGSGLWPMHREIMGLAIGDHRVIHHINENPLDNRRENLMVCANRSEAQSQPHPLRGRACVDGGRRGAIARWGVPA